MRPFALTHLYQFSSLCRCIHNEKYGDVVRSGLKLILYQGEGTNGEYYCYDYSNLTYQEGHDVEVPYTLHYVCNG